MGRREKKETNTKKTTLHEEEENEHDVILNYMVTRLYGKRI